jgi:hypothetical protein
MILFINEMIIYFCDFIFEEGIENGSEITMIINNNNSKRTTHFIHNGRIIPHTIINIPYSGVYIGVCIKKYT